MAAVHRQRRMRSGAALLALGVLGALVLVAAGSARNQASLAPRTSITIAQSASIDAILPDVEPKRSSLRVSVEVLEAATRYVAPRGGFPKIAPSLATSWRPINPTTWQFKVRPNVRFSNGEPLTANNFKFSLDVYRENKAAGAFVFAAMEIKVIDKLTFNVTTQTKNFGALPSAMSFLFAYPMKYYRQVGKTGFGRAPVGTGPYKVTSFRSGIGITLERNPTWWGPQPAIKTLKFQFVPDPATRVALLQTGKADLIADMPPSLASRMQSISSARVRAVESQRRIFYFFNTTTPPLDNVLVRRAINYAVNKNAIVKGLFRGRAYKLEGIFIDGELGYTTKFKGLPYSPAKARELLTKAGFPNGVDIKMYYTVNGTVLDKETALAVSGMLNAVGIRTQLIPGTENSLEAIYDPGKMDGMGGWSYGPIYNDSYFLTNIASFSSTALYGSYSKQGQATTDRLTNAAVGTTVEKQRQTRYESVQKHVITNSAYWLPLYALQDIYGMSKCLNWYPRADQNYGLEAAKTTC